MTYDIQCQGGGRCDRCAALFERDLCDDPLLRTLKEGCLGFVTDAAHAALPYPHACLRFNAGLKECPLAWLDDFAVRIW
jgi:hypothetical protein